MGEDQDAAGPRGLDEADGGDRLAGAGRMLEPESAARVGVVDGLGDDIFLVGVDRLLVPVLGLLVLLERVVLVGDRRVAVAVPGPAVAAPLPAPTGAPAPFGPLPARFEPGSSISEMIAASVPESAST